MKLQTFLDYLTSLSIFLISTFSIIFFSASTLSHFFEKLSINQGLIRSLAISQHLIYLNGSFNITNNTIIGLGTGKYNEIDLYKLNEFIKECQNKKDLLKEIIISSDFFIKIDNLNCSTKNNIPTIKRIVVINNTIKFFEIGIII